MWLEIGKIVAPQGLKGEVRVYPDSDFPERFIQPGRRWLLRPEASEPQPVELLQGRYLEGKGLYVIKLQEITTREQAEALRNSRLLTPESDRPTLEPDEFHVVDLIGLAVILQSTQTQIGQVVDVLPAGNDLLEVELNPSQVAPKPSPEIPEEGGTSHQNRKQSKRPKTSKSKTPTKILIPFVKEIVPIVNLEQGKVEINPPSGLLEMGE